MGHGCCYSKYLTKFQSKSSRGLEVRPAGQKKVGTQHLHDKRHWGACAKGLSPYHSPHSYTHLSFPRDRSVAQSMGARLNFIRDALVAPVNRLSAAHPSLQMETSPMRLNKRAICNVLPIFTLFIHQANAKIETHTRTYARTRRYYGISVPESVYGRIRDDRSSPMKVRFADVGCQRSTGSRSNNVNPLILTLRNVRRQRIP